MADIKAKTKSDKTNGKTHKGPPQPERPKFGIPELAAALDLQSASVRVQLRKAGVSKKGKLYGWDTKDQMLAVIEQLKGKKTARHSKSAN